jgi:hypothetical protein
MDCASSHQRRYVSVDETSGFCEIKSLRQLSHPGEDQRYAMLQRWVRDRIHPFDARGNPRVLPLSERHRPRDPRTPSAGRRSETHAAQTASKFDRSSVLDRATPSLVALA